MLPGIQMARLRQVVGKCLPFEAREGEGCGGQPAIFDNR
jgi:hypothetical protein